MLYDAHGLAVSTDSPAAVAHLNRFIDQALSYGKDAEDAILKAVIADRSCAIAYAYAAAYFLSQENAVARKHAVPHLKAARRYLSEVTEREQWYVWAVIAWANKAIDEAIALHQAIVKKYPRDLISVQQGQYHYFYRGDAKRLLQIAEAALPANSDNHYLYGMVAFGLEQCGQLEKAEMMGRRAVEINQYDPWAQHAVAHVLDTQERVEEGIAWMERCANTWERCNSMLYTHNWWHLALYYLALGNTQKVLQLYDTHVWGGADPTSPKDQVGAIATLLRLELRGIEVGNRWQELAPYLQPRLHEHSLPFQDLHYIYALSRAGYSEWVTEMLESVQAYATALKPPSQQIWVNTVLPTAKGIVAHAIGDWSTAIAQLQPALLQLQSIGGSHTQRNLFKQIYQDALLQAEQPLKHYGVAHIASPIHRRLTTEYSRLRFAKRAS